MANKYKPAEEWLLQAEYDLETADAMFKSGRYIYTIFMLHLSLEKALKGIYAQTYQENPPKTHHLLYLIDRIQSIIAFQLPDDIFATVRKIDKISIPVRYPENLAELSKDYTKESTKEFLESAKEVLNWLNSKLNR